MTKSKSFLMVAYILVGAAGRSAHADPPRMAIVENGHSVDIAIHTARTTTVQFSKLIVDAPHPPWKGLDFRRYADAITLHPRVMLPSADLLGSFNVKLEDVTITINLRAAPDREAADSIVQITSKDQWQGWQSAIRASLESGSVATTTDVKTAEMAILRGFHDLFMGREISPAFMREVLSGFERYPIEPRIDSPDPDRDGVTLAVQAAAWFRSPRQLLLGFNVYNSSEHKPLFIKHAAVLGDSGQRDHAGEIFLDAPSDGPYLARIPPKTTASGLVFVRQPYAAGATVSLMISTTGGALMQTRIPVIDLSPPKTPEEIRDDKARGMVALQLKVLGGIIFLPSGLDSSDQLGTTSIKGLGVRVTYGFNRYLSLEVEAIGASSGKATFEDVMFDGSAGDLRRGAALGRGQFGVVISIGETIVPSVRAGLGAQGASHDSELRVGTGDSAPGPDFAFDFSGLWYAGIGLDIHLSDSFVANLAITAENPVDSDTRAFEAGLNVGYRWRP